jgi:hypothetical protein
MTDDPPDVLNVVLQLCTPWSFIVSMNVSLSVNVAAAGRHVPRTGICVVSYPSGASF